MRSAAGARRLHGGGGGGDRLRPSRRRRWTATWSGSISRVFLVEEPLPKAKAADQGADRNASCRSDRPGDFAQGLMDLGATLCTPKRPACALCPWMRACRARAERLQESLPRKAPKREGSCAAARPSWRCAPTARCCCARGSPKACSAAWPSRRRAPGAPITIPARPCSTRPSTPAGSACRAWSGTSSPISRWSSRCSSAGSSAGTRRRTGCAGPAGRSFGGEALPGAMKKVLAHALERGAHSLGSPTSRRRPLTVEVPSPAGRDGDLRRMNRPTARPAGGRFPRRRA